MQGLLKSYITVSRRSGSVTVLRGSSQSQNTWLGVKLQSLHDQGEDQHEKFSLAPLSVWFGDTELVLTTEPIWRECKTKP